MTNPFFMLFLLATLSKPSLSEELRCPLVVVVWEARG